MNRLKVERQLMVLSALVEGSSVRSIERMTGVHRDTILRLMVRAGENCERLHLERVREVAVQDVQCDEIWAYIYCKEKNKPLDAPETWGDAYCFVAIERFSKLILAWRLGKRDRLTAEDFMGQLRDATADERFQLTTDGLSAYVGAVDASLIDRADYAMLVKVFSTPREAEQRYSPGDMVNAVRVPINGNPDPRFVCTSHIERQNLTMRMQIRRLTRLTNAFSKKWGNLKAALALYFCWYNFCRVHMTLRVTPAMEAGIADHVWDLRELLQ